MEKEGSACIVMVTCSGTAEAEEIAERLLEKRLVACANWFPVKSAYRWKGKLFREDEALLVLKTREGLLEEVREKIRELHSYDLPAIESFLVGVDKDVKEWLIRETSAENGADRED